MDDEEVVCDIDCETQCELARVGRICPTIAQYRREMRERINCGVAQPLTGR